MQDLPITIIGAGISGMLVSLGLARHNIPSVIIEKQSIRNFNSVDDVRAIALSKASQRVLTHFNIWDNIKEFVSPIEQIYIMHNFAKEYIHLSKDFVPEEQIGFIIKSSALKNILYELVRSNKLIKLLAGLSPEIIETKDKKLYNIQLRSQEAVNSGLIIACDGANSLIREKFFSDKINKDYKQKALVFVIKHRLSHDNSAIEHFLPGGSFATLPLESKQESGIVWVEGLEEAELLLKMPKEKFLEQLSLRLGGALGEVEITSKVQSYSLSAKLANKYVFKNIVLVGDAAHFIHPLAGQGLNLGIKDMGYLIDVISKNYNSKADLESLLKDLKTYEEKRVKDNLAMFYITDTLNRVFSRNSRLMKLGSKIAFNFINSSSLIKKMILNYANS